eukprot:jgi/Botrbrau1/11249/Bobra.0038s0021.1
MGGGSGHGQHNKPHKSGKFAGRSARERHRQSKEARKPIRGTSAVHTGKAARVNAAKQHRDAKREQILAGRRSVGAPRVVALLPLSERVEVNRVWSSILNGTEGFNEVAAPQTPDPEGLMDVDTRGESGSQVLAPLTAALGGHSRQKLTFLPPPTNRGDPLAIVDLGAAAEVILCVLPGEKGSTIDAQGKEALAVLRALGLPSLLLAVQMPPGSSLKERAAAKKAAAAELSSQVAGDHKVFPLAEPSDAHQIIRQLVDIRPSVPHWRLPRPSLMLDAASYFPSEVPQEPSMGTLVVRGYIRNQGLSANQLVHVPGAGDFQIAQICGPQEPEPVLAPQKRHHRTDSAMDVCQPPDGEAPVLATPNPDLQESLVRENVPDPLAGEQTWPTDEELGCAEAGSGVSSKRRRKLPEGVSEYQAAWIPDLAYESASDGPDDDDEAAGRDADLGSEPEELQDADLDLEDGETDDFMMGVESEDGGAALAADQKRRWREQQDDVLFPDEVDTPTDKPARERFAKYRGLKSWRTSPWDPKEGLPRDYARIFAFENPRRTQKRAIAAQQSVGGPGDPHGVAAGTYVEVHLANVPQAAAAALVQRVGASLQGKAVPLVAFGLLQHEGMLSVLNFSIRKASSYTEPLPNKAPLLFVTGLRQFEARPIFSTDEANASKFKMERFLHAGRASVATLYGPISYSPLPLLAFAREPGSLRLAASGSLKGADPDRVVLKKIVLTGFPVKVHKRKAVVRWMFHNPGDILWFRPLELWTKYGRRGRIKEAVGTHGAMKCIFEGQVLQKDAVCVSLYKRAYPVWPTTDVFI